MTRDTPSRRWPAWGLWALAAVALLRLGSLGQLALTDNTESRYGGIAREMARSGDWITPWTGAGGAAVRELARSSGSVTPWTYANGDLMPFWGKPPLQFWLTAISYRAFGVSEFSARLPSFLVALALVAATICFAAGLWGRNVAVLAGIVLATSLALLVLSGACELDVPLTAGASGAMMAFALFARRSAQSPPWPRKAWGLAFFLALAVGALAKGPVALVLVGASLGLWLLVVGRWRLVIELPWISGTLLFLAVAAPWYLLAERATPGFLRYFLINENFLRYLTNDYGDYYGYGRLRPYGSIWLMFLLVLLPWTLLAIALLARSAKSGAWKTLRDFGRSDPWLAYVLIWGLTPPLFFTLARQVLWTYVLPGFPGLAIAMAVGIDRWMQSEKAPDLLKLLKWHVGVLSCLGVALSVAGTLFYGGRPGLAPAGVLGVAALTVLAIAVLGWLARAAARRQDGTALVAAVGLAGTVMLTSAVCLFRSEIDDGYSTKVILAEVYKDPAARQRPVAVPLGESTFSASFYVDLLYQGHFDHFAVQVKRPKGQEAEADAETARQLLDCREDEILLLKRSDWKRLGALLTDRLEPIAQTANWVACQRRH